jgi:hypothetical protein
MSHGWAISACAMGAPCPTSQEGLAHYTTAPWLKGPGDNRVLRLQLSWP